MRHYLSLLALAASLILFPASSCGKQPGGESGENPGIDNPPAEEIGTAARLASFNIRFATEDDTGVKAWDTRKVSCAKVVERYSFGVFGIQEALPVQQSDLAVLLPAYSFYFVGRDDGTVGEAVGVAWLTEKYECKSKGHFWLSPTPDIPSGSMEWGGLSRHRVAVWAVFEDKGSGAEFFFLATHLEVGEDYTDVRLKSAELIIEKEKALNPDGFPAFVVGDMNPIAPTEKSMRKFRETYVDSWQQADADGTREGPIGSYNAFNPDVNLETQSRRGDYIFYKGDVSLVRYKCIDDQFGGQYPSDHVPVMVDVKLPE